jgi:hypothetical protein
MGQNFAPELIRLLQAAGCSMVRHGKGDHDIWESRINGRRFPVDRKILSQCFMPQGVDRALARQQRRT